MRHFVQFFLVLILTSTAPSLLTAAVETVEISIQKMRCGRCAENVRKAIKGVSGVSSVSVDLTQKKATVRYEQEQTKLEEILQVIAAEGCPSEILLRKTDGV